MSRTYARVEGGVVREVHQPPEIHDDFRLDELFHIDLTVQMLDVTNYDPMPQQGWITRDHGKTFQPPPAS